jgi:hypothetical protein
MALCCQPKNACIAAPFVGQHPKLQMLLLLLLLLVPPVLLLR